MRIVVTTISVALMAAFAPSVGAEPPPWAAKYQLPAQASSKANPPSKALVVIPPPPIVIPPPPPLLPPVFSSFTTGQTVETAQQERAAAAVAAATQTVRVRLAQATSVSVISMVGRRGPLRVTKLRPVGRVGDMEITRWRFSDRYGRRIGDGNLLCRWATITRRLCWGEIRLPRGRLVMLGSSQTRVLGEFAVIGGTGVYLFKQGLLSFRQLSATKYALRVLLA